MYVCMYVCMYVAMCICTRAGQAESCIPACYHTYIVQVRGHARLRWVAMRLDEMRAA